MENTCLNIIIMLISVSSSPNSVRETVSSPNYQPEELRQIIQSEIRQHLLSSTQSSGKY